MLLTYILLVPLLAAFLMWVSPSSSSRFIALVSSIVTAILSFVAIDKYYHGTAVTVDLPWIQTVNTHFHLELSSWNVTFVALTAVAYLLVYSWFAQRKYKNESTFYALLSLSQIGITGVFLSFDALLFYFFWELALIPIYFLCSSWGGENRLRITFKFFIYTFVGSVLMLVSIMYLYNAHGQTMDWHVWVAQASEITQTQQNWMFWLLFIGLGVKIPLFPLHSWQADTYAVSPRPVLVILSAVMSKMGLFGFLQWMVYILPGAYETMGGIVIGLTIFGIIYASMIAMVSDSMVRVMAFSSIAHLSLMVLALFSNLEDGSTGLAFQALSHGLVIIALWMIIEKIEYHYGTSNMSEIGGGLASSSPVLAMFFVFFAFANVGLPLTMNFIGEFILFKAVFAYNPYLMLLAGTSVIFGAVYMLRMLRMTLYGATSAPQIRFNNTQKAVMAVLVLGVIYFGVYPYPILEVVQNIYADILLNIK